MSVAPEPFPEDDSYPLWKKILIALDEVVNALTNGNPHETVSARAARARNAEKKWGCILCKILDWIDKSHCDNAIDETKTS